MMKRIVSLLSAAVLLLSLLPAGVLAATTTDFAGGLGTESDPYLIATKYHLNNVRNYPEAHFKMTADVVFTDADFAAGGDFYNAGSFFAPLGSLAGSFNGNGHAIKNIKINYAGSSSYTALFSQVSSGAVLKNLDIEGGFISGTTAYVAAFAGTNSGTIENCRNTATIAANGKAETHRWASGIVANNWNCVQNCRNDGDITASCTDPAETNNGYSRSSYTGGIVANNHHTVTNCHNTGQVYSHGVASSFAGGIIGYDESSIGCKTSDCSNAGAVTADVLKTNASPHLYAGGIVGAGNVSTSIINCYNIGNVTILNGSQGFAGGIMGKHDSNEYIKKCYNLGEISTEFDVIDAYVGGVTGHNASNGRIWSCYNAGRVYGKAIDLCYVGGVSGYCLGKLNYCYNNASVTGETESQWDSTVYAGGVVGLLSSQYVNAINCYNTGDVSGAATYDAYVGGFVGYLKHSYGNSYTSGVDYANYTTGMVSKSDPDKGTAYLGAVAGKGDSQLIGSDNAFYYVSNGLPAKGTGTVYNCYSRSTYQMGYKSYLEYMDFDSVWYFDKSFGFEYPQLKENPQAKPKQLVLLSSPASIPFKEGIAPELNGIQIKVIYENGLTTTVDVTLSMLPDLNLALIGKQNIKVKYGGIYSSETLTFEGTAKKLTAIKVTKQPDKISFHQDEAPDFTGLVVYAYYDNQQSESITDYEITALDTSSAGRQLITVSKDGYYDAFYVSVTEHDYYHEFSSQMHWLQCCYCTDKLEETPHVFENDCDSDCVCGFTRLTEHQYDHNCDSDCNVCGQFRPITHNHVPSYNDTHHFYHCTICGDKVHVNVHMFSNDCDPDCSCGYTRSASHRYDNDCDSLCNLCGAPRPTEHTFGDFIYNYDATAKRDGTMTRVCAVCNLSETMIAEGTQLIDSSLAFTDVPAKAWYKPYVDFAVTYGIFSGKGGGKFEPNADITRGEFVQVLANITKVDLAPYKKRQNFTDVKRSDWFAGAVNWAYENGIVNGKGAGKFDPNAKITRQEMCIMLVNYADFKGITLLDKNPKTIFADHNKIDSWARNYVYKCQMAGLVNGKGAGTFDPQGNALRAEVSVLFTNFFKEYMK